MPVFKGDLEIELSDKYFWVSKFKSLTAELEEIASQKATSRAILKNYKPDKLVFETWNINYDSYMTTQKYAFGVLYIFRSTCPSMFSQA